MSAQDQMRAMLDELMGTGRDGKNNRHNVRFDDPRVCKSFLLSCCPHDILSSTRMDLGDCPKFHDLALRADYETASKNEDYYYDIDAMEHLESFIGECDRKTELAKRRLKETQEELSEEAAKKAEVIHALGEHIGTKLAKSEEMGAEGNVEESLKYLNEVEELKKEKAEAEIEYRNSMPASSYQQQKLRVCEICSAYLGIHDNDRRLADHFGGKLHLGFITIRDKLDDLQKSVAERRAQREQERELRRQSREAPVPARSEREPREAREPRDSRDGRESSRRRSRSRDRRRGTSSRGQESRRRSRSRERRRHRSRSKSRDRRKRSRSRERRRRSRSKSRRSRSRSKSKRRSRSRSRSRKSSRRSRSGSRSRRTGRRRSRSPEGNRSRDRSPDRTKADLDQEAVPPTEESANGNQENGSPSFPSANALLD